MKLHYISQQRQLIKSFYAGIGKTAVILPSAFLVAVGLNMVALGIIFYMRDIFQASASQIGLLAALWSLCYIAGCLFMRPFFDRFLPPYMMIIATLSMCVFTLLILYAGSLSWTYILYGLHGFSTSLFWSPLMTWLSRKMEGIELGKVISKFNFSWSTGVIVGPLLAGWWSERAVELPLYLGSLLFLLSSFIIIGAALALPGIRRDKEPELFVASPNREGGEETPLRYLAWVGLYTTYVVMGVILFVFPVSARNDLSISKSLIGLLLLARALFMTVGFVVLGKTTFWHFKSLSMFLGQGCLAISLVFMVYARSPLPLGLALAFMGLIMALGYSNSLFHGVSGSSNRAWRMAIHESLLSAGMVSGSFMGGILYERYAMPTVYWFCLGLVALGIVIQAGLCLKRGKGKVSFLKV